MSIYRAHEEKEIGSIKEVEAKDTRRPPSNVPYVVDNLWAWTRPEAYPDRRKSKFASPRPEQALRSRGLDESRLDCAFRLEFVGDPAIAQLPGVEDAKEHPDNDAREHPDRKDLRSLLFEKLGGKFDWTSKPLGQKRPASQLFQPCLTAGEVERLFDASEGLRPHKDEIRRAVTYWEDLELIEPDSLADEEKGEIIFEFKDPSEGDGYRRRPVENGRQ